MKKTVRFGCKYFKSSQQSIPNLVNSTTWSRPRCGSMTPKIIGLEYTVVHWPYVNRMGNPVRQQFCCHLDGKKTKELVASLPMGVEP